MPLYIYDPDIIDKLAQVEGAQWAKGQRTGDGLGGPPAKCGVSVQAFVDAWKKLEELRAEGETWTDNLDPEVFDGPHGDRCIYGDGGYARYIVRPDGEVILLRWSTRLERIELAERAGISVSG